MPYKKSRARIAFQGSASALLKLSNVAALKKSAIGYDHQNLVFQSAVFRLCATVEEYLKAFTEDLLYEFKEKMATLRQLPLNLRASLLLNRQMSVFKAHLFQGDELATLRKLQPTSHVYKMCVDSEVFTGHIGVADVIGTKKYPSLDNLKVVYNRLGIPNIMQEAHKRGKKDYTSQMESFLDVREAISHQVPPSLTINDVKRHFRNVDEIIGQFDRIVYSHLSRVSKSKFWPA